MNSWDKQIYFLATTIICSLSTLNQSEASKNKSIEHASRLLLMYLIPHSYCAFRAWLARIKNMAAFALLSELCINVFTAVSPQRLYKTHAPCIHYHLRDKSHKSHHGFIKRARLTPSLLTLSPLPLFLHWRSPLPFCLLFLFPSASISWAMLAVSISICNLDFIQVATCWTAGSTFGLVAYFQGQYFLYFSPFVCSIFLIIFIDLVVFVFDSFLSIIFLHAIPRAASFPILSSQYHFIFQVAIPQFQHLSF